MLDRLGYSDEDFDAGALSSPPDRVSLEDAVKEAKAIIDDFAVFRIVVNGASQTPERSLFPVHVDLLRQKLRRLELFATPAVYLAFRRAHTEEVTFAGKSYESYFSAVLELAKSCLVHLSGFCSSAEVGDELCKLAQFGHAKRVVEFLLPSDVEQLRVRLIKESDQVAFDTNRSRTQKEGANKAGKSTVRADPIADGQKKYSPRNLEVQKLDAEIRRKIGQDDYPSQISIAIEFADGNQKRAQSLLRMVRKLRASEKADC